MVCVWGLVSLFTSLFIGLILLSAYHRGLINGTIASNCRTTMNRGPCHVFRFFLSTVELSFHRFFPVSSLSFPTHGSPYNNKKPYTISTMRLPDLLPLLLFLLLELCRRSVLLGTSFVYRL